MLVHRHACSAHRVKELPLLVSQDTWFKIGPDEGCAPAPGPDPYIFLYFIFLYFSYPILRISIFLLFLASRLSRLSGL